MWAWSATELAAAAEAQGRSSEAHRAYEAALVAATRAAELGAEDWTPSLLRSLWQRRMALFLANRPQDGLGEVERYVATFPRDAEIAWDAGVLLATLVGHRRRAGAEIDELRALGARGLELMESALDFGLRDRARVLTDTRLRPLRGAPSLEALLARVPD